MNTTKTQQGMTLIELMIAMAISLVLLGGVLEVYLGSKQSYNLVEESSRLQENGRFAIEIMTREIRSTDFWGCLKRPNSTAGDDDQNLFNGLDTASPNYDPKLHDLGEGIIGFDNLTLSGAVSPSDSISLTGGDDCNINVDSVPGTGSVVFTNIAGCLSENDIAIISNCTGGDIFQVTSINPNGALTQINHNTGSVSAGPGNYSDPAATDCPGANAHCFANDHGPDSKIYKVGTKGYDIRPTLRPDGTLVNGLYRTDSSGVATEIIENVENMQILYGEDTDNPVPNADRFHIPNQYVTATDLGYVDSATPGRVGDVVTVRLALLLRGERDLLPANTAQNHQLLDTVIATNDQRIYKVFTTTVTIRNRALVDPIPR